MTSYDYELTKRCDSMLVHAILLQFGLALSVGLSSASVYSFTPIVWLGLQHLKA